MASQDYEVEEQLLQEMDAYGGGSQPGLPLPQLPLIRRNTGGTAWPQLALVRRIHQLCGTPGQVPSEVLASIQCNGLPAPLASEVSQEAAEAGLHSLRDYRRLRGKQAKPQVLQLEAERALEIFLAQAVAAAWSVVHHCETTACALHALSHR